VCKQIHTFFHKLKPTFRLWLRNPFFNLLETFLFCFIEIYPWSDISFLVWAKCGIPFFALCFNSNRFVGSTNECPAIAGNTTINQGHHNKPDSRCLFYIYIISSFFMDKYGLVITFENGAKKRESPTFTEKLRVPNLAIRTCWMYIF